MEENIDQRQDDDALIFTPLYVKKKGERVFSRVEGCIDAAMQGPEVYIKKNKERLITTATLASS